MKFRSVLPVVAVAVLLQPVLFSGTAFCQITPSELSKDYASSKTGGGTQQRELSNASGAPAPLPSTVTEDSEAASHNANLNQAKTRSSGVFFNDPQSGQYLHLFHKDGATSALGALGNPNSVFWTTLNLTEPGVAEGHKAAMNQASLDLMNNYLSENNLFMQYQLDGTNGQAEFFGYRLCMLNNLKAGDDWTMATGKCRGFGNPLNTLKTANKNYLPAANSTPTYYSNDARYIRGGVTGEAPSATGNPPPAPTSPASAGKPAMLLSDMLYPPATATPDPNEKLKNNFKLYFGDLSLTSEASGNGATELKQQPIKPGITAIGMNQGPMVALYEFERDAFNALWYVMQQRCVFHRQVSGTAGKGTEFHDYVPFADSADTDEQKYTEFWKLVQAGKGTVNSVDFSQMAIAMQILGARDVYQVTPEIVDIIYNKFVANGTRGLDSSSSAECSVFTNSNYTYDKLSELIRSKPGSTERKKITVEIFDAFEIATKLASIKYLAFVGQYVNAAMTSPILANSPYRNVSVSFIYGRAGMDVMDLNVAVRSIVEEIQTLLTEFRRVASMTTGAAGANMRGLFRQRDKNVVPNPWTGFATKDDE